MRPRQLVAAFKFNEKTFVWRCDRCSKMFFLEIEEAQFDGIPRLTVRQFESHFCALAAASEAEFLDDDFKKIVMLQQDDRPPEQGTDRE